MKPATFHEAQLIDYTPRLVARAIIGGVQIGDRRIPRRAVARHLTGAFAAWWRWTVALPGDRFWCLNRDVIVVVAHGTPRRRTVRVIAREALQYPIVARCGFDVLLALTPREPSTFEWWHLVRSLPARGETP